MFHAGQAIKITGTSYRQLDNLVRNRLLRPSCSGASGRGSFRRFSARDLLALRVATEILGAGHHLGPFMHILRFVQDGRELPPIDQLDGKVLVSNGREAHVIDGAQINLSGKLEARSLIYVIELGAAARHVLCGIERIEKKSSKGKVKMD
jgi:DNA-binding transcriptional MerR regulator